MADLKGLTVRRVSLDDLAHLTTIFERTFPYTVDQRYFEWKYLQNPSGPVVAHEAVTDDGQVAAFYGAIPETYAVNGAAVRVYQSMDTMTAPEFQRRGLFVHLAELTYDAIAEEHGHCVLIGISGEQSLPGFVRRLAWAQPAAIRYIFAHPAWLPRAGRAGFEVGAIERVGELDEFFSNEPWQAGPISVALTPRFFQWRVMDHRLNPQRVLAAKDGGEVVAVCGYAVEGRGRTLITVLAGLERDSLWAATPSLLRAAASASGARWIFTWEPPAGGTLTHLGRMRFIANRTQRGPFSHRATLITRADTELVQGVRWSDGSNFDLQPFMHD